jgi:hypothetical protein
VEAAAANEFPLPAAPQRTASHTTYVSGREADLDAARAPNGLKPEQEQGDRSEPRARGASTGELLKQFEERSRRGRAAQREDLQLLPRFNPFGALVALSLILALGAAVFVTLWAGLNFAFGTALDGPVGAWLMETPCQRLAASAEPLVRYALGRGRASASVCHFASGSIRVDGQTEGLGFTERELVYLILGLVGYALCFVCALVTTTFLVRMGWRKLSSIIR